MVDPRSPPLQEPVTEDDAQSLAHTIDESAVLEPKARYRIAARVLSRERYYLGWGASVAPLDLALGWGELSDPAFDTQVEWHQGARWYFWNWRVVSPLDNQAVALQSANVHVVPATENLKRALLALDAGDVVQLRGYLVNIQGPDGQRWRTSLARTDTGGGSCELLYTTELITDDTVYH